MLIQTNIKHKPTHEMVGIIESKADEIKVNAFAGAGKTTTLKEFALARPMDKFLYIAFNKSVQLEANSKFPKNVTCKTGHSIAYSAIGHHFQHKLAASIRPYVIAKAPDMRKALAYVPSKYHAIFINKVIMAITSFISSEDESIDQTHFNFSDEDVKKYDVRDAVKAAQGYWDMMCDVDCQEAPMVHDGYLKLFLDSGKPLGNYTYLMLDEGQDSNPVNMALFNRHESKKIMVGDTHQSIYQFRGAINAMDDFIAQETHHLTQSFRFGPRIAEVANCILHLKGEEKYLFGQESIKDSWAEEKDIRKDSFAYISRSNAGLFMEAANAILENKKVHFVGGVEGYDFGGVEDAYNLHKKQLHLIKDPLLKQFKNFDELKEYYKETSDGDLGKLIACVELMSDKIPLLLSRIKSKSLHAPINEAHITLSTIHKSKGLEFDRVRVDDLFDWEGDKLAGPTFVESIEARKAGKKNPIGDPVINAAYVAVTRAKHVLSADVIGAIRPVTQAVIDEKKLKCSLNRVFSGEPNPDSTHEEVGAKSSLTPVWTTGDESFKTDKLSEDADVSLEALKRARRRTF